jgi:hypothetical protein
VPFSRTIVDMVVRQKVAFLTSDAQKDDRFDMGQSIRIQHIRSAMCVPLWDRGTVIGVIHVDSPIYVGTFKSEDLDLLTALANFAAVAIERASLHLRVEEDKRIRTRLERYHSPAVIEEIIADSSGQLARARTKNVTVFSRYRRLRRSRARAPARSRRPSRSSRSPRTRILRGRNARQVVGDGDGLLRRRSISRITPGAPFRGMEVRGAGSNCSARPGSRLQSARRSTPARSSSARIGSDWRVDYTAPRDAGQRRGPHEQFVATLRHRDRPATHIGGQGPGERRPAGVFAPGYPAANLFKVGLVEKDAAVGR